MIPTDVRTEILTALHFAQMAVEQYQYPSYEIRRQRLDDVTKAREWVIHNGK